MENLERYKPITLLKSLYDSDSERSKRHIPQVFNIFLKRLGFSSLDQIQPLTEVVLSSEQVFRNMIRIYSEKYISLTKQLAGEI